MAGTKRYTAWLAAAMFAWLAAACGGGDGGPEPTAQGTIGPAGGTLASADGTFSLTIPAGALASPTAIVVTELTAGAVPAELRAARAEKYYRFEPSGTVFAQPARVTVHLPLGAPGDLVLMALVSGSTVEAAAGQSLRVREDGLVLQADVPHFSHGVIARGPGGVTGSIRVTPATVRVGETALIELIVAGTATEALSFTTEGGHGIDFVGSGFEILEQDMSALDIDIFGRDQPHEIGGYWRVRCVHPGVASVQFSYRLFDIFISAIFGPPLGVGVTQADTTFDLVGSITCEGDPVPPTGSVVSVGLFQIPGLTAPDGINYFAGPVAGLGGTGPYAAIAGAEGVKVVDLVTHQVVLDRTVAGPDGATLGHPVLGAVPVAQAASAGAPAAMVGYGTQGAFVQNRVADQWGLSVRTPEPVFDAVTPGNTLAASILALVRPVFGVDFVAFDPASMLYRADPSRFAPYAAFPGTGNLVAAQLLDAGAAHLLVLGRASAPGSTATSTKVFHKNVGDAQPATTLLSMGSVDARRLRCIPVAMKHACVVGLTGSGQGKAFLFDPASPQDTPRVTTLTAEAGTLGVALARLPNGRIGVVMANFTAASLTVAELSADLETIHSSSTVPAPAGCTATAHVALLTDGEGIKAVVTCNGTGNYWISKPFG